MISEFTAAFTAATAASKMAGGILKLTNDVKVQEAVIALNHQVIDLQTKLFAAHAKCEELTEIKREIERKLVARENWNAEADRYQLVDLASGIPVYALNPDKAGTEPLHYLCPNCFQKQKKSILHRPAVDHANYKCDECSFDVRPTPAAAPIMVGFKRRGRMDGLL